MIHAGTAIFRGEISPRMTGCVVIKAWNVLFQAAAESQPRPFSIILHYSHPQRKLAGNDLFLLGLQGQMQSVHKFPVSSFQNTTLPRTWLAKSPADGTSDGRMTFRCTGVYDFNLVFGWAVGPFLFKSVQEDIQAEWRGSATGVVDSYMLETLSGLPRKQISSTRAALSLDPIVHVLLHSRIFL